MLIDLHNHTSDGSPDSDVSAHDLFLFAKTYHIDGIGVTEHGTYQSRAATEYAALLTGVRAFQGIELNSSIGHLVVYGPTSLSWLDRKDEDIELETAVINELINGKRTIKISELRRGIAASLHPTTGTVEDIFDETRVTNGCIILAHPFAYVGEGVASLHKYLKQWFAEENGPHMSLPDFLEYLQQVDPQALHWVEAVDAIEVQNGLTTNVQNSLAKALAEELGKPQVAGSDTHRLFMAGRCLTWFDDDVTDLAELSSAIRLGRVRGATLGPDISFEEVVRLLKSIKIPDEAFS